MVLFTSASQYPALAALRYGRLFENASPEAFPLSTANAVREVLLPLQPSRSVQRHFLTHWVLDFASPLDIPLMAALRPAFESQLATDPERARHSPLLYATWSAKPWLVNHSAALNAFGSKYFAWMDAGQFRQLSRPIHRLPSSAQLAAVFEEAELPSSPPFPAYRAGLHPHPSSAPVASRQHKALLVAVHPYTRDFCRPLDPASSHPSHLLLDQHAGSAAPAQSRPPMPLCWPLCSHRPPLSVPPLRCAPRPSQSVVRGDRPVGALVLRGVLRHRSAVGASRLADRQGSKPDERAGAGVQGQLPHHGQRLTPVTHHQPPSHLPLISASSPCALRCAGRLPSGGGGGVLDRSRLGRPLELPGLLPGSGRGAAAWLRARALRRRRDGEGGAGHPLRGRQRGRVDQQSDQRVPGCYIDTGIAAHMTCATLCMPHQ